ncbi:MAG TPA: hypothetical protein V6D08_10125 [Candidatus Obscuribacterales bacterium]
MMRKLYTVRIALSAVAVAFLGTMLPQASIADTYYRTYTYSRTVTSPAVVMTTPVTTVERVVEHPALIERVVEKPVMVDRVVEKPVTVERVVEKPVTVERVVEKPVLIEKRIESPVIIERKERRHLLDFGLLNFSLF